LDASIRYVGVLFVEDVERRQADVGNFLLAEHDWGMREKIVQRHGCLRRICGCAARNCDRHPGHSSGAERRQGFPSMLSLWSLLRARHAESSCTSTKYSMSSFNDTNGHILS
jgi:hypothetical protein